MSCEHCNGPGLDQENRKDDKFHFTGTKCCWARAMEIESFKKNVKHKYIFEPIFDLIVSVSSVGTDIIALLMYIYKGKYTFAVLTMIPVLLPTLVFTNVYLVDEKKRPVSKVTSISGKSSIRKAPPKTEMDQLNEMENGVLNDEEEIRSASNLDSDGLDDSSTRGINESEFKEKFSFHFPCVHRYVETLGNCFRGCFQCFCNRDLRLRKRGAYIVRKNFKRLFKYGLGTFVLRIISAAWYIKAFIYGVKAYRAPKKFMKIETPNNHWSYELLVRLEFLQAALENAPQCVIQLYALITQADEDKILGMLTLAFSFIDFIRVSVYVHWDMDKGPVTAPNGCYDTILWKMVNTSSWILIYSARSAAIAFVFATSGFNRPEAAIPIGLLILHIFIFARILSKAEYGVAAQKIFVTVFISVFFLPELSASVLPAIPQFYYATIIIENAFFILPWDGFDKIYCVTSNGFMERNRTQGPPKPTPIFSTSTTSGGIIGPGPDPRTTPIVIPKQITAPTTTAEPPEHDCLIDPTLITLAVPTLTVIGVIFRLASTQKMVNYRKSLPMDASNREKTQNKLETSIANLFSKKWTQMTPNQLFTAFIRMLRKEVLLVDKSPRGSSSGGGGGGLKYIGSRKKRRNSKFQAAFLASQTYIRESFSFGIMPRTPPATRTVRSYDLEMGTVIDVDDPPPDYNSDSELTFRSRGTRKRPRISRSRNVSESRDVCPSSPAIGPSQECTLIPVELPSGTHYLETCWV